MRETHHVGTSAERLARIHAEIRGLEARSARAQADYRAGTLPHDAYVALSEELRGCLRALGLELYDIHAAPA